MPAETMTSSPTAACRCAGVADRDNQQHVVRTAHGPIRGERRVSYLGHTFYSFRSVPYAKSPLGELRFRDPQPPDAWTEPLDATRECVSAPYYDDTETATFETSEDCLLLNVYTNQLPDQTPAKRAPNGQPPPAGRPVMVWLHGGTFRVGSSSEHMYGPDFLLSGDVVVVTVNYRLGALGFASFDDPAIGVPGNAGIKDQSMALRWVRANIAAFGGDARNVTLFGNSAGACCVHLHMLSSHSAGLFDKAIVQSGSALSDWSNYPKNDWTKRLAVALGWTASDGAGDAEMYAFLCAASAEDIVKHQDAILTSEETLASVFSFGPACEAYVSEQCIFVEEPERLAAAQPWSRDVPLMIGSTSDEGLLLYRSVRKNAEFFQSTAAFEMLVPPQFGYAAGSEQSVAVARTIRKFYYGEDVPSVENIEGTLQMWGDRAFWHGVHKSVVARLDAGTPAATYLYRYAGESGRFNWKKLQFVGEDLPGASHADEVHFLFKCAYLTEQLPHNCRELKTMREMVGMWTQFATTGNPNCAQMGDVVWEPVVASGAERLPFKCLNIGATISFIELPETARIAFWDRLYAEHEKQAE